MTYINEYISTEDRARYKIDDVETKYERLLGLISRGRDWTFDKEKDSYLILVKFGNEFDGELGIKYFLFFWGGIEILVKFKTEGGGERKGHQWRRYKLLKIDIDDTAPQEQQESFKNNYDVIISDLKQALISYKDLGVRSNSTYFEANFDF
ncbi:hypothetical protein VXQ28_01480 [Acinetobacter oleivorans]|nr:hypothetical protein [Acinetobacter seifertii]QNX32798.1 hypothetical protein IC788_12690 [Acinetobacter seifertii]